MNAKFITIEGVEGVGKSTQVATILATLDKRGIIYDATREPGGTPLAEELRSSLLTPRDELVPHEAECLMMFAARQTHLENRIKPALNDGKWVVCDRFTDATYAYQGAGRGVDLRFIEQLEQTIQGDLRPDLTIVLDADVALALGRAKARSAADRFEQEKLAFFERIRAAYLQRAKQHPERYRVIDAARSIEEVTADVESAINDLVNAQ